jgi:hypothetical protein
MDFNYLKKIGNKYMLMKCCLIPWSSSQHWPPLEIIRVMEKMGTNRLGVEAPFTNQTIDHMS